MRFVQLQLRRTLVRSKHYAAMKSIYDNGQVIIPMALVSHVEYLVTKNYQYEGDEVFGKQNGFKPNGIMVITKYTNYDFEKDTWNNGIFIPEEKKEEFIKAFTKYRATIEKINQQQWMK